jgi:hypothetical protein
MANEPKLTPSDEHLFRREAERLIAAGEMPSLAELLSVVAEVRAKYRPQIVTGRKEGERPSK